MHALIFVSIFLPWDIKGREHACIDIGEYFPALGYQRT